MSTLAPEVHGSACAGGKREGTGGGACRARLADARLHFQHGPIDILIGADGEPDAVAAAHEAAWLRFETVLDELVAELSRLRTPVTPDESHGHFASPIAQRMWAACLPFARETITPMAAVAGSVAQELVAHYRREGVSRAWINNGGDIAWHLAADARPLRVGLFADLARFDAQQLRDSRSGNGLRCDGRLDLESAMPARGLATSGWRGRSFSFGIADSVTVLAATAAQADAAATVIANAVDVPDSRIIRRPACELRDDSDLGTRRVTVAVPPLAPEQVEAALAAGLARAHALFDAGLIHGCTIVVQSRFAAIDPVPLTGAHPC